MDQMISYCGLNCTQCPIFVATKENDDSKRKAISEEWGKLFKIDLSIEDINCDGCLKTDGRLYVHCNSCNVRECALSKEINSCGLCKDYGCSKIQTLFEEIPEAKEGLERFIKELDI